MGVMLMLVALQLAGAALFVVAKTMGNMDAVEGGIAAPFRALAGGIAALRTELPVLLFQLMLLLAFFLVNWASYRLSLALFRRRDL
jgi:steroid 5-alpha reductase family enzyme